MGNVPRTHTENPPLTAKPKPAAKPSARAPLRRSPLAVAYLPLDRLKPDPGNARRHSAKQIGQIAKSIEAFGFNVPVLIDGDGHVVAGHGRLAAARRLGLGEIPAIRLEGLSEPRKRAFGIADNRLAEAAVWDDRRLGEQLAALAAVELDFDLEAIGFEIGEIDLRIERLDAPKRPAKAPPKPAGAASVSRAGDLWRLGAHELLCGAGAGDCDVILRAWQAHAGATARHAVTGASFDEMARLRAAEAAPANEEIEEPLSVIARSSCEEATQRPRCNGLPILAPCDAAPGLLRLEGSSQ
jgi:hypothetical protein